METIYIENREVKYDSGSSFLLPMRKQGSNRIDSVGPINMGVLLKTFSEKFDDGPKKIVDMMLTDCNNYLSLDSNTREEIPLTGSPAIALAEGFTDISDPISIGVKQTLQVLEQLV